jgi:uncharacterized SAM-binding protein YcdF (DUF218 family)
LPASVRPGPGSEGRLDPQGVTARTAPSAPAMERLAQRSSSPRRSSRWSRPWGRWVLLGALGLVALVVLYYVVTLFQVWSTGRHDEARPVDAIVVLGAAQYDGKPSPLLAGRLDHALELYREGYAETIVVTGGKQPLDRFTEAAASAAYLEERGVPAGAIVREGEGRTSYESLQGVARLLEERGLDSVLIVTDPFHSLRSRLIAEDAGLEAYVSPTTTSVVTGAGSVARHLEEAAGVAVGRLLGFDRL